MIFSVNLMRQLDVIKDQGMKNLLWNILTEIEEHREVSVTKTEFNELKEIVRGLSQSTLDLVKAQARTEKRLENLADAQARTEKRLESLAKAQEELAQAQKETEKEIAKLSISSNQTRTQLGGLSRSVAYALENEAYRKLLAAIIN